MVILKTELKVENALVILTGRRRIYKKRSELIVLVSFLDAGIKELNMVRVLFQELLES